MFIKNVISRIINNLAARLYRSDAAKTEIEPVRRPRTQDGRFDGVPFDLNRAKELRRSGASVRAIARELGVSKSTVAAKLAQPVPEPEPAPQNSVAKPAETSAAASSQPARGSLPAILSVPRTPPAAKPAIPETTPAVPLPKWWNELSEEEREHLCLQKNSYPAVFLTDNAYDCERTWHYLSACISFDCWYENYLRHPAIAGVERFWVYSTSVKFFKALQASPIREKCRVLDRTVFDAARWRLELHRERQNDDFFERCLSCREPGLRPIPAPPARIDDLLPPPEPKPVSPVDFSYRPPWMLGGSFGSR